jgi:hypothetical protein
VINSGTATVDAVGQHAGMLKMGANAVLNISAGRLDVEEEVQIGLENASTAALNLSGGTLATPLLTKGAAATFNFTGGTLHAGVVGFDLVNNGGTIAPGSSPGTTIVMGELALNSGVLEIEIDGRPGGLRDVVSANGPAYLGGTLRVKLVDLGEGLFTPQLGDNFGFLVSAGTEGMFDQFDLPPLDPGLGWSLNFGDATTFLTVVLAGDYNQDGTVGIEDYTVWRDLLGGAWLPNETASLGIVDHADYDAWKANFGATAGGGSGSVHHGGSSTGAAPSRGVPEPVSLLLAWIGGVLICLSNRRTFVRGIE